MSGSATAYNTKIHNHRSNIPRRQMSMGTTTTKTVVARLKSCGLLQTKGLIGGEWTYASDGRTVQVNNPGTGDVIASVACMGDKETKDAISSAYHAFGRNKPPRPNSLTSS